VASLAPLRSLAGSRKRRGAFGFFSDALISLFLKGHRWERQALHGAAPHDAPPRITGPIVSASHHKNGSRRAMLRVFGPPTGPSQASLRTSLTKESFNKEVNRENMDVWDVQSKGYDLVKVVGGIR